MLIAAGSYGGDLSFSDPANVRPMPTWAVGQANRSPDLDALPGFQKPPPGFGIVPFFWWLGDPLTQERLGWELKQMAGMGASGFQINYAHSDEGGHSYGLTYPSEPPLFSPEWWKLTGWFMQESKKQGAGISLSDYTLGLGQGWCVDELLREHPDLCGQQLHLVTGSAPADALVVTNIGGRQIAVRAEKVPLSIDPMNPQAGLEYAKHFFGKFEDRFPGESGRGLNFFFSDELEFRVGGNLWTARFAEEFKKRKGYDLLPELPALFMDIGPRTPKVRLDYSDVKVALTEEGFFQPVFDWHQRRGMTMGCDHGGRGRDVVEFGDYFRTQRWNQGPGADQPNLGKDLIKAKVASSIAHLYQRPRVWLEGFYGSGWGTTSAGVVDATFADFVMGYNLLSFHGMYYATHGGWWEWAPPDNTFRMPYWKHLRGFMDCVQRLSCLLSQGHHRCDIAILYPVAPMEAGMDGKEAVRTAFSTGEQLYARSIDFDFMDFESLARAKVVGKELRVSGEVYKVLILPAMKAVRHSTLHKALEFHRAGGVVVAPGALPEASDHIGRDDPEVAAMVKEIFPDGSTKDIFARLPARDYDGPGYVQHRKLGSRDLYAIYNAPKDTECAFRASGKVELWDPWTGATRPLAVTSQTADGTKLKLPLTEKEIQLVVFSPGKPEIASASSAKPVEVVSLDGDWEFELQPTSDNRFGDFNWPPTPALIGAEARQLWYCEGDHTNGPWRKVTCSFGPQFIRYVATPANTEMPAPGGKPYEFSWRWGVEGDPGHQGYHGLKEQVHDEFIALGSANATGTGSRYEADGSQPYLWTTVVAPREMVAYALIGDLKPAKVWLNGEVVTGTTLRLKAGANPLVLQYTNPGRTYFVVSTTGGNEETASAEVFTPSAFYIWYPNDQTTADRWFRRTFDLDKVPAQARLRITCDNSYAVTINGIPIGSGGRWEKVQEYDVSRALRRGSNEIVVHARNDGGEAGLIAELTAGMKRISTDHSWRVAKTETGEVVEAEQLANFTDSLWYKHQMGPPKLEPVMATERPKFKASPLAMSWSDKPGVLPYDVRPNETAPVGWYRFVSPPGLRAFTVPARGEVQAWAGNRPLTGKYKFTIPQPSAEPVTVWLRIQQERGCYAGAALREPIKLDCGPGRIALGDWSKNDGLLSYSGGAWYRKTVRIPDSRQVTLNLGEVVASAEVRVNGQLAGVKVSPPWRLDITKHVKAGENRIEVLVCNTLANHYTTVPTRYRGQTISGLLGPVQLEMIR
jgi:alpha-L-rhamnosidase